MMMIFKVFIGLIYYFRASQSPIIMLRASSGFAFGLRNISPRVESGPGHGP